MRGYSFYREYFANVSKYLKLGVFCKECGVSPSTVSTFIKYGAHTIGLERLSSLYDHVVQTLEKIA